MDFYSEIFDAATKPQLLPINYFIQIPVRFIKVVNSPNTIMRSQSSACGTTVTTHMRKRSFGREFHLLSKDYTLRPLGNGKPVHALTTDGASPVPGQWELPAGSQAGGGGGGRAQWL